VRYDARGDAAWLRLPVLLTALSSLTHPHQKRGYAYSAVKPLAAMPGEGTCTTARLGEPMEPAFTSAPTPSS
jgi:hypothetical protein